MAASDPIKEKDSFFTGYAGKVSSVMDVGRAYRRIKHFHPDADHIISAYTIASSFGGHDDRGYGASLRLQKLLESLIHDELLVLRVYSVIGAAICKA